MSKLLNFNEDEKGYESWYANTSPAEIRKLKGRQIVYVTHVDPYRGYYTVHTGIIHDAHYSMIVLDEGNESVDKRSILEAGINVLINKDQS